MIIYASTKKDFVSRASNATIADYVEDRIQTMLHRATPSSEKKSWENSLGRMGLLLLDSEVPDDAGVAIEYTIPMSSKRIDILISGTDEHGVSQIVIIELKQWEKLAAVEGQSDVVETYVSGHNGLHPHPSYQAWSYAQMMRDFSSEVQDRNIKISPCAYLHNYKRKNPDPLDAVQYHRYEDLAPAFTKEDAIKLKNFIAKYVRKGDQAKVLFDIENGAIRPSKSLQDVLTSMLDGNQEFVMIDEQKIVYEAILFHARQAKQQRKKEVLIVCGGPGTGKSVVAVNALVALINDGQVAQYVTRNAAPRNVYFERLKGHRPQNYIRNLFRGSGCFTESSCDEFGTILVDEAHRLNEKSGMFHNQGENQIKEIINAAQCSVFFIDEHQQVTSLDVGTVDEIKRFAREAGVKPRMFKLVSQFRCNGSDGYLSWLDHVLYGEESATTDLKGVDYDFRVVDSPEELRGIIEARNTTGVNARIVAGYCWKWIADSKNDTTVHDIKIGDFEISWNLGNTQTWAIDPKSVKEAGCIHTSQGLEFEHVGVIIGEDMYYDGKNVCTDFLKRASTDQSIRGLKGRLARDPVGARKLGDTIVRNTYRTLLTRGSKSCTVYCCDKALAEYLKTFARAEQPGEIISPPVPVNPIVEDVPESLMYVEFLPYYEMRAACGYFGEGEPVEAGGWVKVSGFGKLTRNMFVARACGRSMEPRIHDGDLCVFCANPAGSRQGRIVLVQHKEAYDSDYGGAFSVKEYASRKIYTEDGEWRHEEVVLKPLNKDFSPIVITENEDGQFRVVAEFVGRVWCEEKSQTPMVE